MATDKVNPLDKFVDTSTPNPTTFRVPTLPKISELVSQHGLVKGLQVADQLFEEWRQQHERDIQNLVKPNPTLPAGRTV